MQAVQIVIILGDTLLILITFDNSPRCVLKLLHSNDNSKQITSPATMNKPVKGASTHTNSTVLKSSGMSRIICLSFQVNLLIYSHDYLICP